EGILPDLSGTLGFEMTADWWDVSCDITRIQINYTKTGLSANSSFYVPFSGASVQWNVTRDDFDFFDARISHTQTINLSLPLSWNEATISAFKGSTPKSTDYTLYSDRIEARILNAENGSDWYLLVNSTNIMSGIETYEGVDTLANQFTYSDIVKINASFSEILSDGTAILTVFSPTGYENHSDSIVNPSGTEIQFAEWDISNTIEEYGVFNVECSWNNETTAGYVTNTITLIGETDLSLLSPTNNSYYSKTDPAFTVSLSFYDTGFDEYIDTTLNFDNETDQGILSNNGSIGKFEFTINPNNYDYGYHLIRFNTSIQYYQNKSLDFGFNIINITQIDDAGRNFSSYNFLNVTYQFTYVDSTNSLPISGASFSNIETPSGMTFFSEDLLNGSYSIDISIDNVSAFSNPYLVNFTVSKTGKQPQDITVNINVELIETTLQIFNYNNNIKRLTGNNQTIDFWFNHSITHEFISNLNVSDIIVRENNSVWSNNITLISHSNYYTLNVSLNDLNMGNYTIFLNVSKYPIYESSEKWISFYLEGNETVIDLVSVEANHNPLPKVGGRYAFHQGNNIDISLQLLDTNNGNQTVADPSFEANFIVRCNGEVLSSGIVYSLSLGLFEGSVNTSQLDPLTNYTLTIYVSLTNYEIHTLDIEITVQEASPPIGITFEQLLPYIIGVIIALIIGTIIFLYRKKVVIPLKLVKEQSLRETTTIIKDALNLDHILILVKHQGICIYYHSLSEGKVSADLVGGFISAVSTFGHELETQKSLNEVKYKDKSILLSDGQFIRAALILSSEPSYLLKRQLREFIKKFEEIHHNTLEKWRGSLNPFKNTIVLIDKYFNTSLFLPHYISKRDTGKVDMTKEMKKVLKIAKDYLNNDHDTINMSKLVNLSMRDGLERPEIWFVIVKLRDAGILTPLERKFIEETKMSEEEISEIRSKLDKVKSFSEREKDHIIKSLRFKTPNAREAYIQSLVSGERIVSAPIKESYNGIQIINKGQAKEEIDKILKKAKKEKSVMNFEGIIDLYNKALHIAIDWDFSKLSRELESSILQTKINKLVLKMEEFETKGKVSKGKGNFKEASQYYKKASNYASEVFKLGEHSISAHQKKLNNISIKLQKMDTQK
ncbi:MAG: hypothetical protein ACQERB_03820, partial [Promethearchaeati archaeon]